MKNLRNVNLWMIALAAMALAAGPEMLAGESLFSKVLGLSSGAFGIMIQVLIILVSIFMVGWAIECFINVRRDKIVPPEIITTLQSYIDEGDLEGALQFCEATPNMLTRSIGAPLSRMHNGWDAMGAALEQQLAVESGKLAQHISPLSLVAALGPMLGLFGTVSGMVMAFDQMADAGDDMNPGLVAGSVGLALMSTVMGLLIAMPGMVFYWVFANRIQRVSDEIGLVADEMMDTLRGYLQEG